MVTFSYVLQDYVQNRVYWMAREGNCPKAPHFVVFGETLIFFLYNQGYPNINKNKTHVYTKFV